jgi:hypothetical protein
MLTRSVLDPVEYTIHNFSSGPIYYLGNGGGHANPSFSNFARAKVRQARVFQEFILDPLAVGIHEMPVQGGDFLMCLSSQTFIEVCRGWKNGQKYQVTGKLRRGFVRSEDPSPSYYLDVGNKIEVKD